MDKRDNFIAIIPDISVTVCCNTSVNLNADTECIIGRKPDNIYQMKTIKAS